MSSYEDNLDWGMIIISYPKCGRTWLKVLFEKYEDHANQKLPEILWSHIGYGHGEDQETAGFLSEFPDVPKVLLTRDIADSLVSYYHDDKYRNPMKLFGCEDVNDYVREYVNHVKRFYKKVNTLNWDYITSYEEMLVDSLVVANAILEMMVDEIDHKALEIAVKECEFEKLSKDERAGNARMRVTKADQMKGFYKTRKGKAGSAKEELDPATYEWLQKEIKL